MQIGYISEIGVSMYDSTHDTELHIKQVRDLLYQSIMTIEERARNHDASKLKSPEKEMFDEYTEKLRGLTYGSDEYKATLKEMGVALAHHYENNSHHPEHYENGIDDMDLFDVLEMLCDWVAATRRHADGSVRDSLVINKTRFNISDQLYKIICNTAFNRNWIPSIPAENYDPLKKKEI